VAEAGLQRSHREQLTIAIGVAKRFNLRSLHNQHLFLPRFRTFDFVNLHKT
jgi:hypothetical protein